ncbi:secondary thiamine-phosphate synthase enzyme YjbQ [Parvularcula sp. LCG005]|uniref:secondary thiamine-phosphate synthase enzyme YjbQ n=1 Tax=Parvularcula sp. LCG005 TaxID=3078805 RepID=UPI002942CA95|nr:secondary thiamine-phosphate synthase enzyme YjbQ [Parvularcula sp. LCG005]WOI54382.1 secondary thiamine-phosphate synthase enzyme YjbQ [Parvularcula sp. LCG005]
MKQQAFDTLTVETRGPGLTMISRQASRFVDQSGIGRGLFTATVQHTSASLTIQENADPDVQTDLQAFFERIVPEGPHYIHDAEGPDDMPAHIKSALTLTSVSIPVMDHRLMLGTWQGLYLFEHRTHAQRRRIVFHLIGE